MKPENYPKHVSIMLDGNRRWAKAKGLLPWEGHRKGADKVKKLMEWSKELEIREITVYAFSIKNFNRKKIEVDKLMDLFAELFEDTIKKENQLKEDGVRIRFLGRLDLFNENVREKMDKLAEITKNNDKYFINFAMGYDGQAEIVDSCKKIFEKVDKGELKKEDIDEKTIQENLYLDSPVEIIVRTSGEKRISGFMLWFASYAELFFLEKNWPDFEKEDLENIINKFLERDRRFGK